MLLAIKDPNDWIFVRVSGPENTQMIDAYAHRST